MTDLAVVEKPQPIEVFGKDDQVGGLVRRMRFMIPGAAGAPDQKIWNAAQLATIHHLDPFSGDVWVYPAYEGCKPEDWIVDVGISAWRRVAQRQAKYTCVFAELSPEETNARVGADYTPEDVGVSCSLYRLDIARECKELGIPYTPTVAYGFWRKHARYVKSKGAFFADQLANTETKADKAQKRAEKKALKAAFSLDFPTDDRATDGEWHVSEVERQVNQEERFRAIPQKPEIQREEDGEILYA